MSRREEDIDWDSIEAKRKAHEALVEQMMADAERGDISVKEPPFVPEPGNKMPIPIYQDMMADILDDIDDGAEDGRGVEYTEDMFNPGAEVWIQLGAHNDLESTNASTFRIFRGPGGGAVRELADAVLVAPVFIQMGGSNLNHIAAIHGDMDFFVGSLSAEALHVVMLEMNEFAANQALDSSGLHSGDPAHRINPSGIIESKLPIDDMTGRDNEHAMDFLRKKLGSLGKLE